jgi:hypothetical protein
MIIYKDILDRMIDYYKGNGTIFTMSEANLIKAIEELGSNEYKGFKLESEPLIPEDKIYLK